MYPPGHLAINGILITSCNALLKRIGYTGYMGYKNTIIPLWPAVMAAILPDITDKVATDYLHWMPYGRSYLHNLTAAVAGGALLAMVFKSKQVGISWFVGLLGHMLGDFVFVPLFWPWVDYNWPIENRNMAAGVVQTIEDLAMFKPLSPLAAAVWQYNRILMECVMFGGVLFFDAGAHKISRTWFGWLGWFGWFGTITLRERVLAMLLAFTAWAYILIKWDYPGFLNYAKYYGLMN